MYKNMTSSEIALLVKTCWFANMIWCSFGTTETSNTIVFKDIANQQGLGRIQEEKREADNIQYSHAKEQGWQWTVFVVRKTRVRVRCFVRCLVSEHVRHCVRVRSVFDVRALLCCVRCSVQVLCFVRCSGFPALRVLS